MATPIPRNRAAFSLGEIARITSGTLIAGRADTMINGITTDSRSVEAGNLYLALRGERNDGHAFVGQALAAGARAALVKDRAALPRGASGVAVPDTLTALGELAKEQRRRWGGRVVAITGSAGKTTTKELAFAALRAAGVAAVKSEGNLNNLIGAPLTLLCLDAPSELCVLEIGTSAPGEIARLAAIAAPEVGVVTAVGVAHTEGLGSVEAVAREKTALLAALPASGTAIYNADSQALLAELGALRARRKIGFGLAESADVRLLRHTLDKKPSMRCVLRYAPSGREQELELGMFGVGPALDAAAAQAVVLAVAGEDGLEPAAHGLARVLPTRGRLCPIAGPSGALVLDDSYNANPASMRASIETALELSRVRGGRALLVLGDMRELGDASSREHEAVGEQAAEAGVAALFACGLEMTRAAASARDKARREGFEMSIAHLADPTGAADLVRPLLRPGDVVLVKGSRSIGMERVVDGLLAAAGGER